MGPLSGITVLEIAGLGPAPFAAMMMADMGAEVIRVDKPGGGPFNLIPQYDFLNRSKKSICVDLKKEGGTEMLLDMIRQVDVLVEGFRPGVMEKLGLSPEVCLEANPKLVYGRMTGWGQTGPLADQVGHDINYIALAGALHPIGRKGAKPTIPLNLVGDFGGGGMFMAFGLVTALFETTRSGKGQVVDAAMIDGAGMLLSSVLSCAQLGDYWKERGNNMLDGGAHFYEVYETADGKYVAVGAIEGHFYQVLLKCLGLDNEKLPEQNDQEHWESMKERFTKIFLGKTRDEWCEVFKDQEACFSPVLDMEEIFSHPHHKARNDFVEVDGVWHPSPAPRFSRTPTGVPTVAIKAGTNSKEVMQRFGLDENAQNTLLNNGIVL